MNIFPFTISPQCIEYSFCFECISDNSCIWDSNSCLNFTELKIIKTQINKNISPKKCFKEKDAKTKNYIDKYCGNLFYNFRKKDESLSISLPVNNNSSYGHNPLYCEYTIYNKNSIESLTINTKINWGSLKAIYKI